MFHESMLRALFNNAAFLQVSFCSRVRFDQITEMKNNDTRVTLRTMRPSISAVEIDCTLLVRDRVRVLCKI